MQESRKSVMIKLRSLQGLQLQQLPPLATWADFENEFFGYATGTAARQLLPDHKAAIAADSHYKIIGLKTKRTEDPIMSQTSFVLEEIDYSNLKITIRSEDDDGETLEQEAATTTDAQLLLKQSIDKRKFMYRVDADTTFYGPPAPRFHDRAQYSQG